MALGSRTLSTPQKLGLAGLLCGVGFAVAVATSTTQAQSGSGQKDLKVGVVDIGFLFKKYKRKDKFEKEINDKRERLKKELETEHKRLKKLRREFEDIPFRKGSDAWMREREKLKLAQVRWELKGERLQKGLRNEVEHNTLQILEELEVTISAYGKRHGFDIILKIDKAVRGAGSVSSGGRGDLVEHFQERIFRAQISDVLYYNKNTMDITKSVMGWLNSETNIRMMQKYQKRKKLRRRAASKKSKKEPK